MNWRKSSKSSESANCVEIAEIANGRAVRDSKNPDGPILTSTTESWRSFIADIRQGRLDLPG